MTHQTSLLATMHRWASVPGVRLEDTYATDIDDLWQAVTDPDRLARWIAHVTGDFQLGGQIEATFTSGAESTGRIDACEPPHRLLVTVSPGQDDEGTIEATLTEVDGGTRLIVEERNLPGDKLPNYGGGWQVHLEDLRAQLVHFLNAQRAAVLGIVADLDDEAMGRTTVPSGWSPESLLRHLADAEHFWFRTVIGGADGRTQRLGRSHAGHLDIARELIDGQTGLGPR